MLNVNHGSCEPYKFLILLNEGIEPSYTNYEADVLTILDYALLRCRQTLE